MELGKERESGNWNQAKMGASALREAIKGTWVTARQGSCRGRFSWRGVCWQLREPSIGIVVSNLGRVGWVQCVLEAEWGRDFLTSRGYCHSIQHGDRWQFFPPAALVGGAGRWNGAHGPIQSTSRTGGERPFSWTDAPRRPRRWIASW